MDRNSAVVNWKKKAHYKTNAYNTLAIRMKTNLRR